MFFLFLLLSFVCVGFIPVVKAVGPMCDSTFYEWGNTMTLNVGLFDNSVTTNGYFTPSGTIRIANTIDIDVNGDLIVFGVPVNSTSVNFEFTLFLEDKNISYKEYEYVIQNSNTLCDGLFGEGSQVYPVQIISPCNGTGGGIYTNGTACFAIVISFVITKSTLINVLGLNTTSTMWMFIPSDPGAASLIAKITVENQDVILATVSGMDTYCVSSMDVGPGPSEGSCSNSQSSSESESSVEPVSAAEGTFAGRVFFDTFMIAIVLSFLLTFMSLDWH